MIEKPFGHSLDSARALNAHILRTLNEDQIFRIDHFLGKDTVQSIMAFRFANGLFEPIWNRDRIDHVQITAAETVGVEERGSSTRRPARCATWSRTTCSHCFRWWPWSRRRASIAAAIRSKKAEVFSRDARRQAGRGGARSVRRRRSAGQGGQGLSARAQRGADSIRRDLCRDAVRDRQLALGRRALLSSHRQAHVAANHRDRDPLQAGALCRVPGHAVPILCGPTGWCSRIAPDEGISLQFEVKRPGPAWTSRP